MQCTVSLSSPGSFLRHCRSARKNLVIQDTRTPVQIERLKRYFKEGDWETDQPIVIEKPEFALLLQNYENTAEDQLRIEPCTFVFFPDGRPSAGDDKRVFIMRAPEGAVLDFEGGCDLSRAKFGRLQGRSPLRPGIDHGPSLRPLSRRRTLFGNARRRVARGSSLESPRGAIPDWPQSWSRP